MGRSVRIGNGCGFWGDNVDAPVILAENGQLDYLTLEYLAELTMSILALQRQRDPKLGFATDFLDVLTRLTPQLTRQPALRVVSNAGGMNPMACAGRAREILDKAGLRDRKIGVVSGDDLLPRLDELLAAGHPLLNLDSGAPFLEVRDRVVSANAYLGSPPIADALSRGASLVITGRVADAALTVGPAMHEHGWRADEWDKLAGGTVAGHLIECGAQVTGGLWCHWDECDLAEVGYPFAEVADDGSMLVSKPSRSGGAVNVETVTEQLLYEVGDPAAYLTPDVVADFTSVSVTQRAKDVVAVSAARGKPAPDKLKVSIAYRDGWAAAGTLVIAGHDAVRKAKHAGEMVLARLARAGAKPEHFLIETPSGDVPEALLRVAVRDSRKAVVERFSRELAPLVTSGPPGVTGYTTGRPQVREVFAYWPALIARDAVRAEVAIL